MPILLDTLDSFSLVAWIDADAVIVDDSRDLASELRWRRDLYLVEHVFVSTGYVPPKESRTANTGLMMLRSGDWARRFLQAVWEQEDLIDHHWWENAAAMRLLGYRIDPPPANHEQRTAWLRRVHFLDVAWNSMPDYQASPTPRIVHFGGLPLDERLERMTDALRAGSSVSRPPSRVRAVSQGGAAGQTTEDIQQRVDELGWWYHHFELPSGVWTGTGEPPAYDPIERWNLFEPNLPDDLEGKSVLDVGGNSGYFSLRMKQRGAGRCLMVEPVVEFVDQATFVFEQFGVDVDVVCEDVHAWCLTTDERFDYVLFLGLFYHLKYPVLVLDRLAEMTKELMVFNSHIQGVPPQAPGADESAPSGLGKLRRSVAKTLGSGQTAEAVEVADADRDELWSASYPRMSFLEGAYRGDLSNWWVPNYEALEPLVRSAGLKVLSRPHPEMVVAEPQRYFGTARYGELVFPRYGKAEGGPVFPGEQRLFVEQVKKT